MIQIQGEEIQSYLLAAAKVFGRYCEENHLRYYLSGGTLLGAVRHQGFIPWDDDIDIMMPRKDYEKLLNAFSDSRYKLIDCDSDKDYGSPYARLWDSYTTRDWGNMKQKEIGIYIDILPIDGYPDSLFLSNLRNRRLLTLRKRRFYAMKKHSRAGRLQKIKELIRKLYPFSANDISRKMNRMARKNDFETSAYVGVQSGTYHQEKERNPRSVFDQTVYLPFEDTVFPAPSGYDVYLTHLFGDYMQLPPEDQRKGRHAQNIFLKEDC